MSPRTLALHLAMTPGVGGKTVARVAARNALLSRSPVEFLALSPESLREEYRLRSDVAARVSRADLAPTLELEARLEGLGVRWVTAADVHYPERLFAFDPDPPGVLFLHGRTSLLDRPTFAVMASRGGPPETLEAIERAAEEGVLAGEVLIGAAGRPEYERASVVPLRWGSPRVLCLDQGLFRVLGDDLKNEAFRAARLWRYEFDAETDLAISPFRPGDAFIGANNRLRDRLVAGLADRLVLAHVVPGGNVETCARLATKAGRTVVGYPA